MSEVVPGEQAETAWTGSDASFGARLALIRQRMGWGNVKEAAMRCGIPVQSWRAWERDGGQPRNYIAVCAQIAAATHCDYGWLVDRRPSGGWQPTLPKISAKLALITGLGRSTFAATPLLHALPPSARFPE